MKEVIPEKALTYIEPGPVTLITIAGGERFDLREEMKDKLPPEL